MAAPFVGAGLRPAHLAAAPSRVALNHFLTVARAKLRYLYTQGSVDVILNAELESADVEAFLRYGGRKRSMAVTHAWWLKALLIASLGSIVVAFLAGLPGSTTGGTPRPFAAILALPLFFVGVLGALMWMKQWVKATYAHASRECHILGRERLSLAEDKVTVEYLSSGATYSTPKIRSIDEHEHWIFAFIDNMAAIIIPRRAFQSHEHEQAFLAALSRYLRS